MRLRTRSGRNGHGTQFILMTGVAILLSAGSALAQGVWFDIGSGEAVTIVCPTDPASWIEFPAYGFGDFWPPGSLVYAEIIKDFDSDQHPMYTVYFSDGGCGCGGFLLEPMTYRFHYDQSAVQWPEYATALFTPSGGDWVIYESTLDPEANVLTAARAGLILGTLVYKIAPDPTVPNAASTWGQVKAQYR